MLDIISGDQFGVIPDDMNWEPEIRPINTDQGEEVPMSRFKGVYCGDRLIAPVGPSYRLVPHVELIAAVDQAFEDAGVDTTGITRKAEMLEEGAKFQVTYRLDNYVIRPKVGDEMAKTFVFRTSHDMSWANSLEYKTTRLICTNGMVTADRHAFMRSKHTASFSTKRFINQINRGIEMMATEEEFFRQLAGTKVTREEAEWFVRETVAKRPKVFLREDKKTGGVVREYAYEKKVEAIMNQFDREDQTAFGVYNALTYWSTHTKSRDGAEHTGLINRERQVIDAIRNPAFSQLCGQV